MSAPLSEGRWVTSWAASAQGAYPVGSTIAQPDLRAALPEPTEGLRDQSLRMILRPALWSSGWRLRLSNVFGQRELRLRSLRLGLHWGGGALVPGTSVALPDQTVAPGRAVWTPAVELPWAAAPSSEAFLGRGLALSASVEGASGPATWHAKSMGTSYLSVPGDREAAAQDSELGFPYTTTSTFFVDALDAWLPAPARALVALGDSLTDGTATTLNGQDRWTDVLQRCWWAADRRDLALVNAGIGGNQVVGPPASAGPWRGGPSALDRLQRDVLDLSGVDTVIWMQGINDFSDNGGAEADVLIAAMRSAVDQLRARGLKVVGATVPSALHGTRPGHGGVEQDARRRAFNAWMRAGGVFDLVADVDAVLTDPVTGCLRDDFNGDSTLGEPGDGVHPNRAGHAAMARCFLAALG
ncbi:MAG: GDSL-type esterase/lipase family protein [Betaproteobacteria bacterium]